MQGPLNILFFEFIRCFPVLLSIYQLNFRYSLHNIPIRVPFCKFLVIVVKRIFKLVFFIFQHLIDLKGKLKTKRYNTMVQSIESKSLGPLAKKQEPLEEVTFSQLNPGVNEGKVVLGKAICSVHSEDSVPL